MDMLHVRSESDIFTVEKMSSPPERIGRYEITGKLEFRRDSSAT